MVKNKNLRCLILLLTATAIATVASGVFFKFPFTFLESVVCTQIVGVSCPPFLIRWNFLILDFLFWSVVVFAGWGLFKLLKIKAQPDQGETATRRGLTQKPVFWLTIGALFILALILFVYFRVNFFKTIKKFPLPEKPTGVGRPTPFSDKKIGGEIDEIRNLLVDKNNFVPVIVSFKCNEFDSSDCRKIEEEILATLDEKDVRGIKKSEGFVPAFGAQISKSGLEKLIRNENIKNIGLDRLVGPAGTD